MAFTTTLSAVLGGSGDNSRTGLQVADTNIAQAAGTTHTTTRGKCTFAFGIHIDQIVGPMPTKDVQNARPLLNVHLLQGY